MNHPLPALLIALTIPAAASAAIWKGDFETGDISQWTKTQAVSDDRIQIVQDPVQEGRYAARITVNPGDDPIDSSGNRNELVYTADMPEDGEIRWYRWSVLWPSTYQSADAWQIFTQWHHWIGGGSPPLAFYVRNEEMVLGTPTEKLWTAPLERGTWHEFIFGVRWSADASVGWVEIELDGQTVLPRTSYQTLLPGTGSVYLKQGLYRSDKIDFEQRLFVDGMTIGATREDVLPPPPFVPEEPAPEPEPEEPGVEPQPPPGSPGEVTIVPREGGCTTAALPAPLALLGLFLRRRRRQQ